MSIRRASSAEQAAETAGAAVATGRSLATPFGADDAAELLLDLLDTRRSSHPKPSRSSVRGLSTEHLSHRR